MFHNQYHAQLVAKERPEQLRREAQHFQQIKEAQAAKAADKQARQQAFLVAKGWAANANR